MTPLYKFLASKIQARANCAANLKTHREWYERHNEDIEAAVKRYMPSGSGFDSGTTLDAESTAEKLVFNTSFHHMDQNGFYTTWTEHRVTVRPSLIFGFTIKISGPNRNAIKELIAQSFEMALNVDTDSK
jgi:hypothetical protein